MTAPTYCIFDGDGGSHLPALPDSDCETVGGGLLFTDDATNPPRPHEHPSSRDWHQMERLIQRLSQTTPMVTIWCTGGATLPTINAIRSMTTNITALNIARARSGAGSYTFTLPANSAPVVSSANQPKYGTSGGAGADTMTASQSGRVITVNTYDSAGDPSDSISFWLDIYGLM